MATSVQSSTWTNDTDADFRAWGSAVSSGIAAVGLVKVPDAGTVNWLTAVAPTGNGMSVAFEIWRFDDALQPTHPVFIKIEYGSLARSSPCMWITVGRGTDGAGQLTGILAPRRQCQGSTTTSSNSSSSIEPIYCSSDGSNICVVARNTGTTSVRSPVILVDRSRDAAGNATAAGGVVLTEGTGMLTGMPASTTTVPAQMHTWTYAGDSAMSDVPVVAPSRVNDLATTTSTSLAVGDKAPVFPFIAAVPNHAPWQVLAACAIMSGDAANGPFTANFLGRIRTFRSIMVDTGHARWMTGMSNGYSGLCILWEE